MSSYTVIPWLPALLKDNVPDSSIASGQNTSANNQNLVLNSTVPNLPQGPYIYDRVVRSIIIYCTTNVACVVTGIGSPVDTTNKNPTQALGTVTENITITDSISQESDNIYSQILSITVSTAVNGISAGFGTFGITDYVFLDYNRKIFQANVQLQFATGDTANGNVYQSLTKPYIITPDGDVNNFQPIPAFPVTLTEVNPNQIGTLLSPVALTWATITGTTTTPIYFTVLQQGIS